MTADDLSREAMSRALPRREVRTYPALVSTEADALAWARRGAPAGSVVVADYQAAPRGRGGLPWQVRPGEGLGCSVVARPDLEPEREGWLYATAACGLADVAGPAARIAWPDTVHHGGDPWAMIGVHVELGPQTVDLAVTTLLVPGARPPRAALLAQVVDAIERRSAAHADSVLDDYRGRCTTFGRQVRALLVPMGPAGPQVEGHAVDVLADGALVVETVEGRRIAVRPQNLGRLEDVACGAPEPGFVDPSSSAPPSDRRKP